MILSSILTIDPEKVDRDLGFLMQCFREVLEEEGEQTLADYLPWQGGATPPLDLLLSERLSQAYSLAFQLLSMVEQNAAVQRQRLTETEQGLTAMQALWGQCLQQVQERGSATLTLPRPCRGYRSNWCSPRTPPKRNGRSCLSITAPSISYWSNAKIRSGRRMSSTYPRGHQGGADLALAHRRNFFAKTGCRLRTAEYHSLPVHRLSRCPPRSGCPTAASLGKYCGFQPELLRSPRSLPRLRFGTWVGGDCDGHPLVTAEVTQETLADLQRHALQLLHHQLSELAHQLSLSDRFQQPPPILTSALARLAAQLGERGQGAIPQNPEESWRHLVNLMLARLPVGRTLPGSGRVERDTTRYQRAAELLDDLSVLSDALVEVGAGRLAVHAVWPVMRVVQTFGFHLASLRSPPEQRLSRPRARATAHRRRASARRLSPVG